MAGPAANGALVVDVQKEDKGESSSKDGLAPVHAEGSSHDGHDEEDHGHGHKSKPKSIITATASAVINFLLMFGLCCAYGMIMFADDHNKRHRALGVKMNLCTAFLVGLALSAFSKVRVAIGGPDLNPVVFIGGFVEVMAKSIAEDQGLTYPESSKRRLFSLSDHDMEDSSRFLASSSSVEFCEGAHLLAHTSQCETYHEELRATTIFAVSVSSALLGLVYFILGRLRLTRLVRYLPSSIMEAFLSCIGYKVFKYALKFSKFDARQFVPAACVGVPLYFMKANHVGNPAVVMPLGLILPVGVFYAVMYLSDPDFDPIKNEKVMFPEIPNIEFYKIWTDSLGKASSINFKAWQDTGPDLAIMLVVCMLDCVLKISSTEEKLPVEVEKDYEISLYGACNLLTTLSGASVGYMQLKFNVINYGVMGNIIDRRGGALYALLCGVCFFWSIYFFNYLPRFFLTALLFFAGSGFVAENLWGSRKFLSFMEWLEILIILAVFILTGKLLYAVAVGVLLCGFSFVRKYASVPVLCAPPFSGREIDTRERRNPLVQRCVNQVSGTWMMVLRLKGFIFFGSASVVTNYVMNRIHEDNDEDKPAYRRLKYVCLDCEFLDGLDASAGKALTKMINDGSKQNVVFIWSHLSQSVMGELQRRGILGFEDTGTQWFPDLNAAVLHVETLALEYQQAQQQKWLKLSKVFAAEQMRMRTQIAFEPFRHVFLYDGPRVGCPWRYCTAVSYPKNSVIFEHNDPSSSLYLVHTGAVGTFPELPFSNPDQSDADALRQWKTPLAVYRHGWFLNVHSLAYMPCTTCAVALEDTQVLRWSREQWRVMAREQALMMHELMRAILKQQAYDDLAEGRTADSLHMDMDNHDWEAFEEHVDKHGAERQQIVPADSPGASNHSIRTSFSFRSSQARSSVNMTDIGVKRAGAWGDDGDYEGTKTAKPSQQHARASFRTMQSNWSETIVSQTGALPQELQIRVPALQAAEALGKLGFFEPFSGDTEDNVIIPDEMVQDLRIAFETFSTGDFLTWQDVPQALMYAGIFEKPNEANHVANMTQEQFLELGRDMLLARLSESHIEKCKKIFVKYDEDRSGTLDVHELTKCFSEILHLKVSAEEIESLADAWSHGFEERGKITKEYFIAIMARFVRKHQRDWQVLCAIRRFIGSDSWKDSMVTATALTRQSNSEGFPLTTDEALEMLWAASGEEEAETRGIDFGIFLSVIFVYLYIGDHKGHLPPPPKGKRLWYETAVSPMSLEPPTAGASHSLKAVETSSAPEEPKSFRAQVHLLLEQPTSSARATQISMVMLVLILLSVFVLILEPLISGIDKKKQPKAERAVWNALEVIFTVIFSVELLVRLCVADALGTPTVCQWLRDPGTITDFVAVLPYFTDLILASAGGESFKMLRIIRMMRIGRVMRISRVAKLLERVLSKKAASLMQPVAVVMVVIWGIYLKHDSSEK